MAGKSDKLSRFWQELKRRKTDRVIVVYAATAFAVFQLADIFENALSLPGWTTKLLIIVFAIGFPIAVVFSWFFDITSGGIEKTKPIEETEREKIESQLRTWRWITMVSLIVIVLLLLFNVIKSGIESNEIRNSEKSIAVFPFRNLSEEKVMAFSSDVVTSVITDGLIQIGLPVCPKYSVMEYQTRERSISDIARKLRVFFVVDGEMALNRNQTIVSINLISARKKRIIWADKYIFKPEDKIDTLNTIALKIAEKLKLFISPEVKQKIRRKPTENATAYLNYLKGAAMQEEAQNASKYLSRGDSSFRNVPGTSSYEKAISFYDKAIEADSTFALAYAKRALTRAWGYRAKFFTAGEQMQKCLEDANNAMRLNPNLTESWIASGFYYYYFKQDYNRALEYFNEALRRDPDNWQCKFSMALVYRAAGNWKASQKLMEEVGRYDPRDALVLTNIGLSYQYLRNYDSAIYFHSKAIRMMPAWESSYGNKMEALIMRDGNTREAENVLDSALIKTDARLTRRYRIIFDIYNGKFAQALLKTEVAVPSDFLSEGDRYLFFAQIYSCLKNKNFSENYYRTALDYFKGRLEKSPDDNELLSSAGIAAAGLNDAAEAVRYCSKAVDIARFDVIYKSYRIKDLAQVYVMLGEKEKSLPLLREILTTPSDISVKMFKMDPVWKPLCDMPGFKHLISEFSGN